jgi:hypothetical protein
MMCNSYSPALLDAANGTPYKTYVTHAKDAAAYPNMINGSLGAFGLDTYTFSPGEYAAMPHEQKQG